VFLSLASTTAGTASMYRCALAVPLVAVVAALEARRRGTLDRAEVWWAALAGVCFAADMLWWTAAISEVGAGLSTVLVNAQIVVVPLLAWAFDGERTSGRFAWALPFVLAGVALTGGVVDHGVSGADPGRGTVHALLAAVGYSGFLYLLRRAASHGRPIQTYLVVLVTSAVVSAGVGSRWHGLVFAPGWVAFGWLCAVTVSGQILGWALVALCSPRLSADAGAALLLATPVGALLLGAVVLGEKPSWWQVGGSVVMLAAAYLGTRRQTHRAAPQQRPARTDQAAVGQQRRPAQRQR
jgi:drug/metabolite transporter (DMT)-like permease